MQLSIKSAAMAACFAVGYAASASAAAYTAIGVQNDVAYDTVIQGGWTELYRGGYNDSFSFEDLVADLDGSANIMLAGIHSTSTTFDVLAYATKDEITRVTLQHEGFAANGATWYYNEMSMGYAGPDATIYQASADVGGLLISEPDRTVPDDRQRLSWHTGSIGQVSGGWRSGANIWLSDSPDWHRVVLIQTLTPAVPEASTYALVFAGLCVVGALRRRQANRQAA